ncbi:MAG: HAD-IIB family hydrolase [Gemmatimonadaceae bacterium]|nr:HAD-IIB family hydrolase [Gemmatimonadaceae bacterium]
MMTESLFPSACQRVVFSDVDGTLLDRAGHYPACWPSVRQSLGDAMFVLTSSRTVEELLDVQQALGIAGPFIAENGAMLVLTHEWLDQPLGTVVTVGERLLRLVPIGTPSTQLSAIVRGAASTCGVTIDVQRGITTADLPPTSVGRAPSVTSHALARAHSILLRISGTTEQRLRFFSTLARTGLTVSHGGRWHVVQGGSSKGIAVRTLLQLIRRRASHELCVIGVGDAQNDRSLLEAVDHRFVMRGPDGTVDAALADVPGAHVPETSGIEAWSEIVDLMHPATLEGAADA